MTWTVAQRRKWLRSNDAKAYWRNWAKKNWARKAMMHRLWNKRNRMRTRLYKWRQMERHGDEIRAWRKAWYRQNKARVCAENRMRHREKRKFLDSLKARPCYDCKKRFPPYCMDFDHCRGQKQFSIGRLLSASLDKLVKEIDKCDVVCANCHRIRTHGKGKR